MKIIDESCEHFVLDLASSSAVPGGGGAAALVGAQGVALASMVANLTLNSQKYKNVHNEMHMIANESAQLVKALNLLVDQDATGFKPLSEAYSLPADTAEEKEHKQQVLQSCTKDACLVPMDIVRYCYKGISYHTVLLEKGTPLAVSDVGVGVEFLRSAIISGWMNICINTKTIEDPLFIGTIEKGIKPLVVDGVKKCTVMSRAVLNKLQ